MYVAAIKRVEHPAVASVPGLTLARLPVVLVVGVDGALKRTLCSRLLSV